MQLLVEGIELAVAVDEPDDPLVVAGQRAQLGLVVRVGQEADVEHQVRVAAGPYLKPKLSNVRPAARGVCAGSSSSASLRRSIAAVRPVGVDDHVRALAQWRQQRRARGDPVGDAARRRERVAAAGLLVAGEQRRLVGLEEQHAVLDPALAQVVEHRRQALEVAPATDVGDDRRARHLRAAVREQLDQRPDHLRGQIVHAEVALVLERRHRGRLARPPRSP